MGQLIGSYGYCNKHGPYGGTRCTLCDKEHAETLQMIWDATMPQFVGIDWGKGKSWTGATTIMTAPTEEQLRDFDFWTREAPARATHCARFPSGEIEWQKRSPDRFPQRWSERRMLWEDAGHAATGKLFARPAKPEPCRVCRQSPCGHYNECPPGKTRAERLKQLEVERDACLLEDALAEEAKPEPKEWDGEGLPPVGLTNRQFMLMTRISCACNDHEDTYYEVVAHFNDYVVVAGRSGVSGEVFAYAVSPGSCRPIKTQAERERDKLVDSLTDFFFQDDKPVTPEEIADAIIAAGWRKGE